MKKRIIFGIIFIVAVAVIGVVYFLVNKTEPKVNVSAQTLVEEYTANEKDADQKYLGKTVVVSGAIAQILSQDPLTILLEGNSGYVQCEFSPDSAPSLKEGANVTVEGLCTGYLMDVILTNSKIVTDETD